MTLRIQCWSGPRNVSTALMYSWAQRSDTTALDEPLYAAYLARFDLAADGRGHPMEQAVLDAQPQDPDVVLRDVVHGPCDTPVLFMKQMAHHLRGLPDRFLEGTENILLTRDPADMLSSLRVQLPNCTLEDTGLVEQVEVLDSILATGGAPMVIESRALLRDPAGMLSAVCARLGLAFDEAMLAWEAGPKPYDGVWAPAWYANAHASTGFALYVPKEPEIEGRLADVLAEATPYYDRLLQFAITP